MTIECLVNFSTAMEKQALLSIVLRLVFHLILFILFVQFYLIEQMGDYIADRATTTSQLKQVTESEFPTITICMDPPVKPSVASKHGFKWFGEFYYTDTLNTTYLQDLENLGYTLNQDFTIRIMNEGKVYLKVGDNEKFLVEPVFTLLQGICYKLEPKFKVKDQWKDFWFHIRFNELDKEDKPTHFVLYLTSPHATLNIATDIWPQYMPGKVKIPVKTNKKVMIVKYDRVIEYTFKTGVKNSSECMANVIKEFECKNKEYECKNQCCHISGCSLPICNTTEGFHCVMAKNKCWLKCLLQKHSVGYIPKLHKYPVYDNSIAVPGVFVVGTASTGTKEIVEEIDVITLSGLIGSVGGSLGMFFGFSFTSYLSFVIEKIVKNIFKL